MGQEHYFIYILASPNNKVVYVGMTNNLKRRIYEHKEKLIPGFTAQYNVNKLVYYEIAESPQAAIEREKQLKSGSRQRKNELVAASNPYWDDLYDSNL